MDQQFVSNLEQTLNQVTLPDSAAIKEATKKLSTEFYTSPASLPALVYIVESNQNEQIRQLAAVEARKLISKHWESLPSSSKSQIKETLLTRAFTEPSKTARHQIARVVTSVAVYELESGSWGELLPLLVNAAADDSNVEGKETATFILFTLLEGGIAESNTNVGTFLELFSKTVQDQSSRDVRVNSVLGLSSAASLADALIESNPEYAMAFRNTIPSIVEVLKEVITAGDSVAAKSVFNSFNDFLLLDAKLLGDSLVNMIQIMLEISVNTQVDEEIRNYGIKFLSSAVSFRKNKVSSKKLGKDITLAALKIASEPVDIEAELDDEDDDNENEEDDPNALALRLIGISSAELPPSQVVSTIFEQLTPLLSSSNQFERRAGLLAVGFAVSGAPDFYLTHLDKIVGAVVSGLKDSELIVRVSALRSLSLLISDLTDALSEHYEVLLPLIIDIIDSATNATVYKYGCASLDALIEFMSTDAIRQYLEALMNKLFHMLQVTDSSKLRAIIVSAIGSTAYAAGISFAPYFPKSVEMLEPFIQNAGNVEGMSEDDIELRALTFENISTMGRAVKSEAFSQFAKPLIDAAYISIKSGSSRLREAGFAFISNMAKVYGKEFAAFLPNIMPEIYECLKQDEFNINIDPEDDGVYDDEDDLNDKIQVHTGITIEKEIASIALSELALGTKELFAPYVTESVEILVEQSQESYGMRETALASLWKIVQAMVSITVEEKKYPKGVPTGSYVDENVLNLIKTAREITVQSLPDEYEYAMVTTILDVTSDLIKRFGPIIIMDNGDTTQLEAYCGELMTIIKGEHMCQTLDDDELPEEDEEFDGSETDALLLESALEVLVSLSIALGPGFNTIFPSFKDVIISNANSKSKNKRIFAIGALAEIASALQNDNPYSDELLQLFMNRMEHDKSAEVRGDAAYGVGVLIYHSANNYSSLYPNIFNSLSKLLSKVHKQESHISDDDEETKEAVQRGYANACGCVARLALKHQEATPLNVVLPILFEHLPLETAYEEYQPVFELLIKLYQANVEDIVPFTPKVIELFSKVFTKEAETDKLEKESTLGREENIDRFRQFRSAELKQQVIDLLKFLESKYSGSVSQSEILSNIIA